MKILIVSQYFYPETFRINDLTRELSSRGHEVVVLTGQPNYPQGGIYAGFSWWKFKTDAYFGAKVIRVPLIPRGKGGKWNLICNYLSFVFSALIFGLPSLRPHRFDACLVFATSPITAALPAIFYRWWKGYPVAVWIQDLWPEVVTSVAMIKSERIIGYIGVLVKWIYQHSDRLLIQSESFRASVLKWGGQTKQIVYLPNWAEGLYQPQTGRPEPGPFRILFAGNLGRAQGLDVVLSAVEILNAQGTSIEWHFMGDGVLKPWLQEQIMKRGLSRCTQVLPRQAEAEMTQTFGRYSALLASLGKDPVLAMVLPSKIQSSMACAMPLLASADGEMARVIQEARCGMVSPAADAQALAANAVALSQLNEVALTQMGQAGRAYYELHFKREVLIDKIVQVFSEMQRSQ